jgi:TRAP-type C4-dicarboxylate transport system permease small subunit
LKLEAYNMRLMTVLRYALAAIVSIQVLSVFSAVIFRYVLRRPLFWSDELATFLLIYITFFGCFIASNTGKLAKVELMVNALGPFKKYAQALSKLISLVLIGVVSYYGFRLLFSPIIQNQKSPAMRLPMAAFFWVVPTMMSFVFYSEILALFRIFIPREPNDALPKTADNREFPPL